MKNEKKIEEEYWAFVDEVFRKFEDFDRDLMVSEESVPDELVVVS